MNEEMPRKNSYIDLLRAIRIEMAEAYSSVYGYRLDDEFENKLVKRYDSKIIRGADISKHKYENGAVKIFVGFMKTYSANKYADLTRSTIYHKHEEEPFDVYVYAEFKFNLSHVVDKYKKREDQNKKPQEVSWGTWEETTQNFEMIIHRPMLFGLN